MLNEREKKVVKYVVDNLDTTNVDISEDAYFMASLEALSDKDVTKLAKDVKEYVNELKEGKRMASNVDKYGRVWSFTYDVMYENFLKNGKWDEEDYHPVFYVTADCEDAGCEAEDDFFIIHDDELEERYGKGNISDTNYVDQVYDDIKYWVDYLCDND